MHHLPFPLPLHKTFLYHPPPLLFPFNPFPCPLPLAFNHHLLIMPPPPPFPFNLLPYQLYLAFLYHHLIVPPLPFPFNQSPYHPHFLFTCHPLVLPPLPYPLFHHLPYLLHTPLLPLFLKKYPRTLPSPHNPTHPHIALSTPSNQCPHLLQVVMFYFLHPHLLKRYPRPHPSLHYPPHPHLPPPPKSLRDRLPKRHTPLRADGNPRFCLLL
mmetsp:Transcript_1314/g.2305  ORF Transcript_1314/g.2305 Transcript_1314/m.2305 type:complete len:211 (-) Transcript_1314:321-953(-)